LVQENSNLDEEEIESFEEVNNDLIEKEGSESEYGEDDD